MTTKATLTAALCLLPAASVFAVPPPNDDCSTPEAISGGGFFLFDTTEATTGPQPAGLIECLSGPTGVGMVNDVWYCWTADCTGAVRISTCGFAQSDTRLAMWDGCGCPTDNDSPLCCNDDFCEVQSEIICDVECGRQYMIQLGHTPGTAGSAGELFIECMGEPCPPGGPPCCNDFDDQDTHGWAGGVIDVTIDAPGPSGAANDFFLRCRDLPGGPSALFGPEECHGDWRAQTSEGCWAFCFDMRIIEDSCLPQIPECSPGGFLYVEPYLLIQNGSLRAIYRSNELITDDVGPNPGWHTVCAPIGPLVGGQLPQSNDGAWEMLDGAPDSDWDTLLSNVDLIQLRVEFTSNPAEIVGYDNICFKEVECPCAEWDADIACEVGPEGWTGNYNVDLTLTNNSGTDAYYILISDANVSPNVIPLGTPLSGNGGTTTIPVTLSGLDPNTVYCFDLVFADEQIEACCQLTWCVETPECDCMQFGEVTVECAPDGTGATWLTFDFTNLAAYDGEHVFLVPETSGVTISPDYFDIPTTSTGGTVSVGPVIVTGAAPGDEVCILVTVHNEDLLACCSEQLCFIMPDCMQGFTPGDLDGDGIVSFNDLVSLLATWGPCAGCPADLNGDGIVDFNDLVILLSNWSA